MEKKLLIVTVLIILSLFMGNSVLAEGIDKEEFEELQEEILDSSEKILSSEFNVTPSTQLLASLPQPEEKPTITVYEIKDKTGQIKDHRSHVFTQGATEMKVTALLRTGQFKVVDRINFDNLDIELQLKENNRFAHGQGPDMGEMSGADFIIEGAITEYQVDKKTEGWGISIGGLGGSKKYAVASTAIDLRVTDTTTGEVIWTESLKRKIEGEKVDVEAFSFMGDNVVEFESGQGKQEVINLVVRTLFDDAVFNMIQRGVFN